MLKLRLVEVAVMQPLAEGCCIQRGGWDAFSSLVLVWEKEKGITKQDIESWSPLVYCVSQGGVFFWMG